MSQEQERDQLSNQQLAVESPSNETTLDPVVLEQAKAMLESLSKRANAVSSEMEEMNETLKNKMANMDERMRVLDEEVGRSLNIVDTVGSGRIVRNMSQAKIMECIGQERLVVDPNVESWKFSALWDVMEKDGDDFDETALPDYLRALLT